MIRLHLRGGLGNQLFQLAASQSLAHKTGQSLVIDCSYFMAKSTFTVHAQKKVLPDIFDIIEKRNFKIVGSKHQYYLNEKLVEPISPLLKKYGILISDENFLDSLEKKLCRPRILRGFFESDIYFDEDIVQTKIVERIRDYSLDKKFNVDKQYIAVHIRLGDLVDQKRVHIPKPSYYKAAIELLRRSLGEIEVFIFTDNPDLVSQKYGELFGLSNVSLAPPRAACEHLVQMTRATGIVCSNSTFSWWAAYARDSHSHVVVPSRYYRIHNEVDRPFYEFWRNDYKRIYG